MIKNLITGSMEKSIDRIESFPGGRHLVRDADVGREEIVSWDSTRAHLDLLRTSRTDMAEYTREIHLSFDENSKRIQGLRFTASRRVFDDDPKTRPPLAKTFEGKLNNLGFLKLGKSAILLYGASKIVKKKFPKQKSSSAFGTLD